jgi:hypothetical protein
MREPWESTAGARAWLEAQTTAPARKTGKPGAHKSRKNKKRRKGRR